MASGSSDRGAGFRTTGLWDMAFFKRRQFTLSDYEEEFFVYSRGAVLVFSVQKKKEISILLPTRVMKLPAYVRVELHSPISGPAIGQPERLVEHITQTK